MDMRASARMTRCRASIKFTVLIILGTYFGAAHASETIYCKTGTIQAQQAAKTVNTLDKFDVSYASSSTLVSANIASVLAPMWLDKDSKNNCNWYNNLGITISSSVPAQSANLTDYARAELLSRNGGVLNMYFSFAGRDPGKDIYGWGSRANKVDHLYVLDAFAHGDAATGNELLVFLSHGIGARAYKTSLDGSGYSAGGTAYLGVGMDGPVFNAEGSPDKSGISPGFLSLELYATENVASTAALNQLYATTNAPNHFQTWGVSFQLGLPGSFAASIDYSEGFGGFARSKMGNTVMFSFSYNRAPNTSAKNAATAQGAALAAPAQ